MTDLALGWVVWTAGHPCPDPETAPVVRLPLSLRLPVSSLVRGTINQGRTVKLLTRLTFR